MRTRKGTLAALAAALIMAAPTTAHAAERPLKPTGLAAAASPQRVVLGWTDPTDETITHYRIYRRTWSIHPVGVFELHQSDTGSNAPTYTDEQVGRGKAYVYRVAAVSPAGTSPRSRYVRAQIPMPITPERRPPYSPGWEAKQGNTTISIARLHHPNLVDHHLDLGDAKGRANPGDKLLTLVSSALAGGDCIDADDTLRSSSTEQVLGCTVKAPPTLGTFLRSFSRGRCASWTGRTGNWWHKAGPPGPDPGMRP